MGGWALPERIGDSGSARHVTNPFPWICVWVKVESICSTERLRKGVLYCTREEDASESRAALPKSYARATANFAALTLSLNKNICIFLS